VAVLALALQMSCRDGATHALAGRYVGGLAGDTLGTTRTILELRPDGSVDWQLAPHGSKYAIRGDTVYIQMSSDRPMVATFLSHGDSLVWFDRQRTYGVWLKASD
jgi:hypothetical protein